VEIIDRVINADASERLAIYLNDHRAGAAGGIALARRSEQANRDTPLGAYLLEFIDELEEEISVLDKTIENLGVAKNLAKYAAAKAAVTVGRLKLNGQLTGYSPLSRVLELEALVSAVSGKAQLWRALGQLDAPELGDTDWDELVKMADRQRSNLKRHHQEAIPEAFAEPANPRSENLEEPPGEDSAT
jgi:hypothetical protein